MAGRPFAIVPLSVAVRAVKVLPEAVDMVVVRDEDFAAVVATVAKKYPARIYRETPKRRRRAKKQQ